MTAPVASVDGGPGISASGAILAKDDKSSIDTEEMVVASDVVRAAAAASSPIPADDISSVGETEFSSFEAMSDRSSMTSTCGVDTGGGAVTSSRSTSTPERLLVATEAGTEEASAVSASVTASVSAVRRVSAVVVLVSSSWSAPPNSWRKKSKRDMANKPIQSTWRACLGSAIAPTLERRLLPVASAAFVLPGGARARVVHR